MMLSLLAPKPQRIETFSGGYLVPSAVNIYLAPPAPALNAAAARLQNAMSKRGIESALTASPVAGRAAQVTLRIDPALLARKESYRLVVDDSGIYIDGADAAGAFYGVCTLIQLLDLQSGSAGITLPGVRMMDWPDFAHRGVMFDVSRDRVPTLQTLYDLVDMLAGFKINQLQLYTEHTFAYHGHETVWKDSSPMTGEEILALDAYCRERFVELVPNQNSFGHMHRWLKHGEYRHLAETPEGILHGFSTVREPYSICPTDPQSIALLADLYDQLLPHFSSRQFNVGLDETFDLGKGRSNERCEEVGVGQVYMDFLKQIHDLTTRRGVTMQFWSDIIVRDEPDLMAELPRDVIALEWGYEADYPFAEHARLIAASGRSFYVCPGTSSWNTLAGRTRNTLGNLANAATNGHANGAIGYLITDWGDHGHMQPLPVSYLGFLTGAFLAWNAGAAGDVDTLDVPALLDAHVFRDRAGVMGRLAYDLGNIYLELGVIPSNSSALFWLFIYPGAMPERRLAHDLSSEALARTQARIDAVIAPLAQARMERDDADLVTQEFAWVADMLRFACKLGIARAGIGFDRATRDVPKETRAPLAEGLRPLIERFRNLWLRRSRPGGLRDSAGRLEELLAHLAG